MSKVGPRCEFDDTPGSDNVLYHMYNSPGRRRLYLGIAPDEAFVELSADAKPHFDR